MHFTDIGDDNGLFMSGIWMNKYQLSTCELWTYDLNTIYHVHVGTSDPYMQNNVCQLEPKMSSIQILFEFMSTLSVVV